MNDLMTDTDKPTEVYMFSRSLFLLPVLLSLALNAAAASVSEGLILGAEQGFLGLQAGSLRFARAPPRTSISAGLPPPSSSRVWTLTASTPSLSSIRP